MDWKAHPIAITHKHLQIGRLCMTSILHCPIFVGAVVNSTMHHVPIIQVIDHQSAKNLFHTGSLKECVQP